MSRFAELSESVPDELLPPLDRCDAFVADRQLLTLANDPFGRRAAWRTNGYLILRTFLPDPLIDAYCERRCREAAGGLDPLAPGYASNTPYMWVDEIRDLCLYAPLVEILDDLIGEPMGLHLNLTGWVSTERNWHQDDYLNPAYVNNHYLAVWMALADISPDAGPFEYVPGSHAWPLLRREKVRARMLEHQREDPAWPKISEGFVSEAMEEERIARGLPTRQFIARRGDVLVWNGRLMHRGTPPNVPGMERRALISHYSGVYHRRDMPKVQTGGGGFYFVHNEREADAKRKEWDRLAVAAPKGMAPHMGPTAPTGGAS